jgi:hypothetical protein
MGATPTDAYHCALMDINAVLIEADQQAHSALLLVAQNARTREDADVMTQLTLTRKRIRQAKSMIAKLHPDCLPGRKEIAQKDTSA